MRAKYGDADQTITITLASLGYRAGRESTKIDNRVTLYDDVYIVGRIKTAAGGAVAADESLQIYAYGSHQGTIFPSVRSSLTGVDAAIDALVLDKVDYLHPIGYITANAGDTSFTGGPWSIARSLGGVVPPFWGLVVMNNSGRTLSATGSDFAFLYQGLWREHPA